MGNGIPALQAPRHPSPHPASFNSLRHLPRHSGESRNPRSQTPRDSALTPHCGQPLRQPKCVRDVDPGFRRGDGVGSAPLPSFRRTPESTQPNSQGQQVNSSLMATPTPSVIPASLPSFRHPFRHSGESRKPRHPPTPRDSASTPDDGQPLRRRRPRLSPPVNPGDGVGSAPRPSFRRKPESTYSNSQGQQVNSSLQATPTPPVIPPPPRHSGESRNPRTPTPRDSRSTPAEWQPPPLPSPQHPFRHSGESRNPRSQTPRDSALTPHCGQPLRQPKCVRDVDPGFRRGEGVGSAPLPSFRRKPEST